MIVREKIEKKIEVDNTVVACDNCKQNIYNEYIDLPSSSWFHVSMERLARRLDPPDPNNICSSNADRLTTRDPVMILPRYDAKNVEMDFCSANCLQMAIQMYIYSCKNFRTAQRLEVLNMTGNLLKQQQERKDDEMKKE